ncbi:MAG: efflux RND transporter periplasmic adaptor subunit [Pseudomonadota bacterium]
MNKTTITLLMLLLLAGCEGREQPPTVPQAVRPAKVLTVTDAGQQIEHTFVGRVRALRAIDVSFEVSGPLNQLPVLEGQEVAAGELLAALDPTDFELAVREAEVQVKIARQDLERKQKVLQQKGIARSVVDDARSFYELQQVRRGQARERLSDSRLVAPFAAVVAERYVDSFVNIAAGTPVVRLNDLSRLLVEANVPEALLATATPEQLLSLHAEFDFLPGRQFALQTYETQGDADSVAQTYRVTLVMDNPTEWNILPGMSATVRVVLKDPENDTVTLLPASALVADTDKSFFVWLFDADTGLVRKAPVQVGVPEAAGVPILGGIRAGDRVVVTGASQLQSGMRVRPLGEGE